MITGCPAGRDRSAPHERRPPSPASPLHAPQQRLLCAPAYNTLNDSHPPTPTVPAHPHLRLNQPQTQALTSWPLPWQGLHPPGACRCPSGVLSLGRSAHRASGENPGQVRPEAFLGRRVSLGQSSRQTARTLSTPPCPRGTEGWWRLVCPEDMGPLVRAHLGRTVPAKQCRAEVYKMLTGGTKSFLFGSEKAFLVSSNAELKNVQHSEPDEGVSPAKTCSLAASATAGAAPAHCASVPVPSSPERGEPVGPGFRSWQVCAGGACSKCCYYVSRCHSTIADFLLDDSAHSPLGLAGLAVTRLQ